MRNCVLRVWADGAHNMLIAPEVNGTTVPRIYFESISYIGTHASPSRILGLDAAHTVEGVTFTNYRINGIPVTDARSGNITTNGFTRAITFRR